MSDRPGPLLATGVSAQIHACGEGRVLKLYRTGLPASLPETERARTEAARAAGAPAPQALGTLEIDGRHGLVLERIDGPTMLEAIVARPQALDAFAQTLAQLHAAMHALPGGALPPLRGRLAERIARADALPPALRTHLASLLDRLPDGDALCHGDFHPGNVLLSTDGARVIDWYDAACGASEADVARTLLLIRHARIPGWPEAAPAALRGALAAAFARYYGALRPVDAGRLAQWTALVAAARLAEPHTAAELAALAAEIKRAVTT
jgi:Ser/Thr protein kinase RdoA (MazF antagonist)